MTVTVWPSAINASTTWLPINPAPPVTSTLSMEGSRFSPIRSRGQDANSWDLPYNAGQASCRPFGNPAAPFPTLVRPSGRCGRAAHWRVALLVTPRPSRVQLFGQLQRGSHHAIDVEVTVSACAAMETELRRIRQTSLTERNGVGMATDAAVLEHRGFA